MARPRPGLGGDEGRITRQEFAALRVELVDERPVEPLVRHGDEPAGGIEGGVVRVRAGLLDGVRAGHACLRHHVVERRERPVRVDRQGGHRPVHVARNDEEAVARVDRQMHRVPAAAILAIEEGQLTRLPVNRKGADRAEIVAAVDTVEDAPAGVERQERRVGDAREELHALPRAGLGIHPVDLNTLAASLAVRRCVAANICKHGTDYRDAPDMRQGTTYIRIRPGFPGGGGL